MKRRKFITFLGCAMVAGLPAARGQQQKSVRIGLLGAGAADTSAALTL